MLESGYVRDYRSVLNWEWYKDANTSRLFRHLILTVNYEDRKWRGKVIKRGQRVTSYQQLSSELNISVQGIRTAVNHLKSTGEITYLGTREYSIITVNNYDHFQQLTNVQQTDSMNNPLTPEEQAKNQQANQQTDNTARNQDESQKSQDIKDESTHVSTYHQQTTNRPSTDRQQLCKKDKESNKANKGTYAAFEAYANEDTELLKALNDYAEMRKQKKKPLTTERAMKMLFSSLDKLASDSKGKIAILNQSIFNNWTGVFPLKVNQQQKPSKPEHKPSFDIDEYERTSIYDAERRLDQWEAEEKSGKQSTTT